MLKNKFLMDYGIEYPIRRKNKMANIKQMSKDYEPKTTLNISELDRIDINTEVTEKEFTDGDGKVFKINVATIDGKEYRIPISVLKGLKAILTKKPNIKYFSVVKTGEGMKTTYSVVEAE